MGNDNSQITFPIEGNNHQNKIKINSKKLKYKESSNNNINNNQINPKQKSSKNQKVQKKNYIVPRISTTPDRNINIPGMTKNYDNNKRYVSYDKPLKASQNNENKNNYKKRELNDDKKIIKSKKKLKSTISIFYITNLLNSIYSGEIDKKFNKINELHLGSKNSISNNNKNNYNKKDISFVFDSIFRYNYFFKNTIKQIKIKSISKNKNQNNIYKNDNDNNIRKQISQPIYQRQKEQKINNDNKYIENKNQNMNSIINIKTNKNNINKNTTLFFNKLDIDEEIISVNNKKKNHYNLINNNINHKIISKKYSESRYITDSESDFISQDEINLVNNI